MRKFYMTLCLLVCSVAAFAQSQPSIQADQLVSGKQYVLVNLAQNASQYMSRTSWDGALYFLGETDSNYADYAITAVQNADGTWSFTQPGTKEEPTGEYDDDGNELTETVDALYYLVLPEGSPNVNLNSQNPATWQLDDKGDNFYNLILREGHNSAALSLARYTPTKDLRMHLNNGSQYFVVTYLDGPWYPDCVGGVTETEDVATGNVEFAANDSTSFNWGFVQPENIPVFMEKFKAYKAIVNLGNDYLGMGGFEEGFQTTYDAALAIYNSAEFNWEEDPQVIIDMINAKVRLFETIQTAYDIEDEQGMLASAIASAESAFAGNTTATSVDAANTALNDAINAFKLGNGDITGFGQNMSFEDLSAQGGNETNGVAGAPAGWNVYIDGKQVVTADEVRAAGVTGWHGVNNDCDGEPKDGVVGFGIWNSGIPQYEISQTIEGLDNGTYVITAGLMVGANGSGSRRTTQRVFGNLNNTYFASEYEYDTDLLNKKEVKDYAGLEEFTTERTMQTLSVRAYVYDGKLTFGVRTDGNIRAAGRTAGNSANGDGWFKTDNFHIQKVGYVGEDAANVANHFISYFENVKDEYMEAALFDEVQDILDAYGTVSADEPADNINNIIVTLLDKIDAVDASISAYQKLNAAIEAAYDNIDEYSYLDTDAYGEIIDDAFAAWEDGTVDEAGVEELIAKLNEAFEELKLNAITVGEYANIIKNPSFEDMSAQGGTESNGAVNPPAGWNLKLNNVLCETSADYSAAGAEMNWCAINKGDNISSEDEEGNSWTTQYTDGEHLWGIWAANIPTVDLYQSFEGLPAGRYTLSCDVVVQYDWAGQNITTQRIYANNYIQMFGSEEAYAAYEHETSDMKGARELDEANPDADLKHLTYAGYVNTSAGGVTDCPRHMEVTCGVGEDGVLIIGFRTNNVDVEKNEAHPNNGAGWFKLDNFQLLYESDEIPTAIGGIQTASNAIVGRQYFSLDGAQIAQPQRGINIVKNVMSDGSVRTVKMLQK